jgi:hypothetical protein
MTDEEDRERPDPTPEQETASQSGWETFAQSRVWFPQTIARLIEQLKARRAGEP